MILAPIILGHCETEHIATCCQVLDLIRILVNSHMRPVAKGLTCTDNKVFSYRSLSIGGIANTGELNSCTLSRNGIGVTLNERYGLDSIDIFLVISHPSNSELCIQGSGRSSLIKDFHILAVIRNGCAVIVSCLTVVEERNIYVLFGRNNQRGATGLLCTLRSLCGRISCIANLDSVRECIRTEFTCVGLQRRSISGLNNYCIIVNVLGACSYSRIFTNAPSLTQDMLSGERDADGVIGKRPSEYILTALISRYFQVVFSIVCYACHTGIVTVQTKSAFVLLGQPALSITQNANDLELIVTGSELNLKRTGLAVFCHIEGIKVPSLTGHIPLTCNIIYRSRRSRNLFLGSVPCTFIFTFIILATGNKVRFGLIPYQVNSLFCTLRISIVEDDAGIVVLKGIGIYVKSVNLIVGLGHCLTGPCSLAG